MCELKGSGVCFITIKEFNSGSTQSCLEGTGFIVLVLWKLTLYTLTLESIFSLLHSTHMLWQCFHEFV